MYVLRCAVFVDRCHTFVVHLSQREPLPHGCFHEDLIVPLPKSPLDIGPIKHLLAVEPLYFVVVGIRGETSETVKAMSSSRLVLPVQQGRAARLSERDKSKHESSL